MIKVTFFGDSVCVGQGVSIHDGWVARVSKALGELAERYSSEIVVSNMSGNGRTTRQALEVMPYEVQFYHPDILIVQFGLNDCNRWESDSGLPRVSKDAFMANLHEIINRAIAVDVKKVFINTNHPTTSIDEKRFAVSYQKLNEEYNRIVRLVAMTHRRVTLSDIELAFFDYAQQRDRYVSDLLLEGDFLHINTQGHKLYFDTIYPKLQKSVVKLLKLS